MFSWLLACSSPQAVKSVKSKVRELTQQGINPHKAAKMAAASITGGITVCQLQDHSLPGPCDAQSTGMHTALACTACS